MTRLVWETDRFNPADIKSAVDFLNAHAVNIDWERVDDKWYVWTGDQLIFTGTTLLEVESFIFGLSVGFDSFPDTALLDFKKLVAEPDEPRSEDYKP